jgi:hypothetical protein
METCKFRKSPISPSKAINKAHQLLNLAQNGIEFTNKLLYRGGDTDLKFNTLSKQDQQTLSEGMHYLHEEMDSRREAISEHLETLKEERSLELAIRTHLAEREHLGNCVEKSAVLANFFLNLGDSFTQYGVKAEIFTIENGDHSFVVLGRKPGSDPNDYTTWGEDAVICDPWLGIAYFPQDLPNHLASYEDGDENRLEPFHPFNHGLKVYQKDAVAALKEGYRILHEHDTELALEHAVNTNQLQLTKSLIDKGINYDAILFNLLKHRDSNKQDYMLLNIVDHLSNQQLEEFCKRKKIIFKDVQLLIKYLQARTLSHKNLLESKKIITHESAFSKGIHPEVQFRISNKQSSFFSFKTTDTPDPLLLVQENQLAKIASPDHKLEPQLSATPHID